MCIRNDSNAAGKETGREERAAVWDWDHRSVGANRRFTRMIVSVIESEIALVVYECNSKDAMRLEGSRGWDHSSSSC